ncbi:MAG TPA: VPGUxxT family thioredoxin-like (seleno)protein, type 2 [Planctomycetota bacterium]
MHPVLLSSSLSAIALCAAPAAAQHAPPAAAERAPTELGTVQWGRALEPALELSRESGRPVFLLFQEIPGCETCRDFGRGPLSQPLLVEAIEALFVPVAIRNNEPGYAAALLERFQEPSWNNPVFRLLDGEGKDLLARKDGLWTTHAVAMRMIAALEAAQQRVPGYLRLVAEESAPAESVTATFAMHCYWEGEARLGALPGVLGTRTGWQGGEEVVEVRFRPDQLSFDALLDRARELECASLVYAEDDAQLAAARAKVGAEAQLRTAVTRTAKASDQLWYLRQSPLRFVPMSALQQRRVNAALAAEESPYRVLSRRQIHLGEIVPALDAEQLGGLAELPPLTEFASVDAELLRRLHAALRNG